MSFDWQQARRNVQGRRRVEITDIENRIVGWNDAIQSSRNPVTFEDDGLWFHADLGYYDPRTGLLKGLSTMKYYYLGEMTVEDFGANVGWFGLTGDTFGYDLETSDYDEALAILTEERGRFKETVAERKRERARNEDRQTSDIQAQINALRDYQQSQSAQHARQMTELQKMYAKQIEDYNLNVESAFRSVTDLITSLQDSAQAPSTIQTLYLDRQAKTYLPTSIRNRGIAGVMSGGGG